MNCLSSSSSSTRRAGFSASSAAYTFSYTASSAAKDLSPPFIIFCVLSILFSMISISERMSSNSITPISLAGSAEPSTCTTSGSSKHLTTWQMASTSRILERNLLPKPSPLLAPLTRPAISTNSITAGVYFSGLYISASLSSLSSGTDTTPTLGSMVQKG